MASLAAAVKYNKSRDYTRTVWEQLQRRLGLSDDGMPGPLTAQAVMDYQRENGLAVDGMVGPMTRGAILAGVEVEERREGVDFVGVSRFPAKPYVDHGYDYTRLRKDVGESYLELWDTVTGLGGYLTSAGGLRSLKASVSANRSATSLHYLGRAFDLATYSALVDPDEDPFVCVHEESYWRVYVRVSDESVPVMPLSVWTYKAVDRDSGPVDIEGRFVDFTDLAGQHGFRRIPMRSSFWRGNRGGAEWWHFQYEPGLVVGETRFGDELQAVWRHIDLLGSAPWRYRNRVWSGGRFA